MQVLFRSTKEIQVLYNFIDSIELSLKKVELINKNENLDNKYSIVQINKDKNEKAFSLKNFWYPFNYKEGVLQNLDLDDSNRNIIVMSPFRAGKSVILSTITFLNYISRLGIIPAESGIINSFNNIIPLFETKYKMAKGFSKHTKEIQDFKNTKMFLENSCKNSFINNNLVLIDEVYSGVSPSSAINELRIDGKDLFENKNNKTILTTHYVELIDLLKIKQYGINLHYLRVNYFPETNTFERTFQLFKNDENNWWISNDSKIKSLYKEYIQTQLELEQAQ